jgi:hypothetical protein
MYDCVVNDTVRPRPGRPDSREVSELRALRAASPELAEAIDLQIELLEIYRRVQSRIPAPWVDVPPSGLAECARTGRALVPFQALPIEVTDLRLLVRQTAELLRRFGAIEPQDYDAIERLGRGDGLLESAAAWYRALADRPAPPAGIDDAALAQVLSLALRPFLSRCAEFVQQTVDLGPWRHGHCPCCGGDPELAVATSTHERMLVCGRCGLQWPFPSGQCPFCANANPARGTAFATPDGRYRVDACEECRRYLKGYDARRAQRPLLPLVDAIATLPLDAAAIQRGYQG